LLTADNAIWLMTQGKVLLRGHPLQGHRLAVTLALGTLLYGCAWFGSIFGDGTEDASAVDARAVATDSGVLAEASTESDPADVADPAAGSQWTMLPGYLTDYQTGLNLGHDLGALPWNMPETAPEPGSALAPLPVRRPVAVTVALAPDDQAREAAFEAGARLAGTPLSQVIRAPAMPILTPLELPARQESYSLADALRDVQWRSDTARRLETLFR